MDDASLHSKLAKHVLSPSEAWGEILGSPVPALSKAARPGDVAPAGADDELVQALSVARGLCPSEKDGRVLVGWVLAERLVVALYAAVSAEPALSPFFAYSVEHRNYDASWLIGEAPAPPPNPVTALAQARALLPTFEPDEGPIAAALSAAEASGAGETAADIVFSRSLLRDDGTAPWPPEVLADNPAEAQQLRRLCKKVHENLARLRRQGIESTIDDAYRDACRYDGRVLALRRFLEDRVGDGLPALGQAYQHRIAAALNDAGSAPRHMLYDRKGYRHQEAYIDDEGVTVALSPEAGGEFQVRTAYRPKHGRGAAEKRIQASEDLWLDAPEPARRAIEDFRRFLRQKSQEGQVLDLFTEAAWLGRL